MTAIVNRKLNRNIRLDVEAFIYLIDRKVNLKYLSKIYFEKTLNDLENNKRESTINCVIENYNQSLEKTIQFDKLNLWGRINKLI